MQQIGKEWLVRTRTGEVLGPFSQRELLEELRKRTFTHDDEIAPSHGYWISAHTLSNREADEFTLTHTRNQTVTRSVVSGTVTAGIAAQSEHTVTQEIRPETLTPPPEARRPGEGETARPLGGPARRFTPLVIAVVTVAAVCLIAVRMRDRSKGHESASNPIAAKAVEGETPFVRQIYSLIHAGGSQAALKQLTQYHEKHQSKGDLEYLIPYGALLITEGDSASRGKKFLEQVLSGPSSPQMKSRAHHWLGYLMLSQEQGDMGEGHFLEALQLNPKDAAARFNLGRSYLKQEKYPQAFDYFALAELEMPELWLVHIYKGRAKAAIQHSDEARGSFKTAVEASPDRWLSYIYYSFFLRGTHDVEGAQAVLRKMLTRDPHFEVQSPAPWGFYQEKVNYAEYLAAFTAVMEKAAGEDRELGKLYLSALLNGPNSAEAKKLENAATSGGLVAKVLGLKVSLDRDASLEDIKVAAARLPSNLSEFGPYAYVLRGVAKERLGIYADAQADFNRALQLEPRSAIARFELASLLRRTQHSGDADGEIKSLLLYHPGYIPAIVPSQNF